MKDISAGIGFFNNSDFFSAHDFFELCWIECDQDEKLFYQGLVQISVGCYHLISGNLKGSVSQLSKGVKKINKYLPSYKALNVEKLISEVELLIKDIKLNSDSGGLSNFWNRIPKLEIIN